MRAAYACGARQARRIVSCVQKRKQDQKDSKKPAYEAAKPRRYWAEMKGLVADPIMDVSSAR